MTEKAALVVLARLESTRLPRKGLLDLGGRPLLSLTFERLRRCEIVNDIILATTTNGADDILVDFGEEEGVPVFRGDPEDVARRCVAGARAHKLDWFVRICGDSPFIDPQVVDLVARRFIAERPDVATNVLRRSYPIGCSAEAVEVAALARLCATTKDLRYLEHVTAFFYENPEMFQIESVEAPDNRYEGVSIAVDTPQDYERAQWVHEHASDPVTAPLDEIVQLSQRWGGKRGS